MELQSQSFETLGAFYLGRAYDLSARKATDGLILYDSKDLVTHAVCVGMTGSGKTGLCLALLEEAAIDGVPAIVIDPKGDLSNLLLTFPDLAPGDFQPWINEDDARKKGLSPEQFAQQQAELWKTGLAKWGQDGARIRRLRESADFAIYTPGSSAGIPVSILRSFAAPEPAVIEDGELFRERVATTATSLLGLLGIDADPIQSREHILLSTILSHAWQGGHDLDLGALIQHIQQPPVQRVGVLDLDSFYPPKDRFALAMRLNNLLAAPGFSAWLEGEPLDVQSLLHAPPGDPAPGATERRPGKPRIAIFSIAHLGDAERMFFVSLLLNQVLGWMRQQPGTTSLRAILYMDEIFGYFPPTANPPSKAPLLTLMKQARAFGVGVVLATQNPVDLDYKGLSNAGTWFVGRLQTERDKNRLLDGLEGAAAGTGARFDRGMMEQTLAGLGNRVFLMNNVHEDAPVVFETRWAMSYLRGPLTRQQIKKLMDPLKAERAASSKATTDRNVETTANLRGGSSTAPAATAGPAPMSAPVAAHAPASAAALVSALVSAATPAPAPAAAAAPPESVSKTASSSRPVLPPDVPQMFVPVRSNPPAHGASVVYRPMLLGCASMYFDDVKTGVDQTEAVSLIAPLADGVVAAAVDWPGAAEIDLDESDLERGPVTDWPASFSPPPASAGKAKNYDTWTKRLADALYRGRSIELLRSVTYKQTSRPGESAADFRARLQQFAREKRDADLEQLRMRFTPKVRAFEERLRRAEQAVQRESEQASASKWNTAISIGSTILGAFLGRKTFSAGTVGRATTAARGASRSYKESQDVNRAGETVQALQQQLADLQTQFDAEAAEIAERTKIENEELEPVTLKPKKTNVTVHTVVLAWTPYWQSGDKATPAY